MLRRHWSKRSFAELGRQLPGWLTVRCPVPTGRPGGIEKKISQVNLLIDKSSNENQEEHYNDTTTGGKIEQIREKEAS